MRGASRVFLVTPLRDEIDNLPRLIGCVERQTVDVARWVVVENGSTDGSKEFLDRLKGVENVGNLTVLHIDTEDPEYALGSKYARIVNRGFEELLLRENIRPDDCVGILDADSFPEDDYFEKLIELFKLSPKVGISSGLSYNASDGRVSVHSREWVRGSCRLWRGACFLESGYIIGPSADTLSVARANLDGWETAVNPDAKFVAREVGGRGKFEYYGASSYHRGNTMLYALGRSLKLAFLARPLQGFAFFSGYVKAQASGAPRIDDPEIRAYFRTYLVRRFKENALRRVRQFGGGS